MWGGVGLHGRPCWGGDRVPPRCEPGIQDEGDHEGPPIHTCRLPFASCRSPRREDASKRFVVDSILTSSILPTPGSTPRCRRPASIPAINCVTPTCGPPPSLT